MIDYDLFKEIELYSKRHVESSSSLYKYRGASESKMFIQCLEGKVAEFSCYFSMVEAGYILKNKPDLQIYSEQNKNHNADLICIGKHREIYQHEKHIHVKSISIKTLNSFGVSFLTQNNDPIFLNPDPNHFYSVMLKVSLSDYKFHKWICSTDVNWGAPKSPYLKSKVAAYIK